MADIKTRDVVKGSIKAIDKAAVAGERMKDAYVRTKDKAEHGIYSAESNPDEYAADRMTGATEVVTYEAVHQFDKQGRKGLETTKENISKARDYVQQKKKAPSEPKTPQQAAKQQAQKQAEKQMQKKAAQRTGQRVSHSADKTVKTVEHGKKTVKQTAKSTGKATVKTAKGSVKTAQKTIKTAEQTAKTTVKTAQATAKTAQKTAQATAKAARAAAQVARAAAKAAVVAAKAIAKVTVAAVKAIVAGVKALVAAIAAGGWVAVVIIVVICLIALIVGSCFGIFFSGEDTGSGMTMQTVVQEINDDYQSQIDTTKANISYDVLEMSGSRAVWPEVLAVYAVKTTTDPDNAQDVASMDESKKAILKDIFWQMNTISSRTENKTETVITETDDGNGNIVETETTVTQTYL